MCPIIIPYRITGHFIENHPQYTFIYSTDLRRKGGMGMQWEMANYKNSFPIPTLVKFCANIEFFYDHMFPTWKDEIDKFFMTIPLHSPIIVPPKIGLGCARLKEMSPLTYNYITNKLSQIGYSNIKIDYGIRTHN